MRVFLNSECNYGSGRARMKKISGCISRRVDRFEIEEIVSPDTIVTQVLKAYHEGEREFIAAGGDGTVNLLLNAIMTAGLGNKKITLGAIGLGSSNDYHKPFRPENMLMRTPVKLNHRDAVLSDLLKIVYLDSNGSRRVRFCLCNASIGVTAEANAFFNLKSRWVKVVQRVSVEAAIATTALRTIVAFHNLPCVLEIDNEGQEEVLLTNMGIIKNPHFSGSLCYDVDILPDDGRIGVCICFNQSFLERVATFIALYRHRFNERPKTRCATAENVVVKSSRFFPLEMDGEVVETNEAEFSVIPRKVRCCI
jgi:diacylglycerol kinase (ATP)